MLKRRDFIKATAVAGLSVLSRNLLSAETGDAKQPNIVFLLSDDQCTYSVGCYGNKDVKTPNMDKLGHDGVIFENHYVTTSICMASRASIMSGMYEYKHGCNFGRGGMQPSTWEQSYPMLLRKAGYFTGFAGKFGIGGIKTPADGFDVWGGGPGQTSFVTAKNKSMVKYADKYPHATLSYGAFGQDFIKMAVKKDKPFCLSISFKAPHKPADPDKRFDDIYAGTTFAKPANFGREKGKHLSEQSKRGRQYDRGISWGYENKYDEAMKPYHQQIYGIDVALGMIREELARSGVADNTVIIYTSDNGYICGSHGYGSKVLPYEESARVPLMIYDPRHPVSGKKLRSSALTANIDFAPTILKLAGLPVPGDMDGKSLTGLLDNTEGEIRRTLALMNVWGPAPTYSQTVVTKQWKYTYWWYAGDGMEPAEELFDMRKDRLEMKNLASNPEYEQALKMMRAQYDKELDLWKKHAAPKYQKFSQLFDRNIAWSSKETELSAGKRK
ncbi:MAG: sulfatase [Kiritimatiellia bacterium]|jgi:arylsulfatase A-like enzyme|nr:sulfatase [Kiritimatiellia bacterium]